MKRFVRILALLLCCLMLTACSSNPEQRSEEAPAADISTETAASQPEEVVSVEATTMRLMETEGEVSVADEAGESIPVQRNMRLFSGSSVSTETESRAGIRLDDTKSAIVGEQSHARLRQEGRKLAMHLEQGEMYFSVSEPLDDDESFDISTSTMTLGIRGTAGYVAAVSDTESIVILTSGRAEITAITGETQSIAPGERIRITLTDAGADFDIRTIEPEEYPVLLVDETYGTVAADDVLEAYQRTLDEYAEESDAFEYAVYDLNHDGISELIIMRSENETDIPEYAYLMTEEVYTSDGTRSIPLIRPLADPWANINVGSNGDISVSYGNAGLSFTFYRLPFRGTEVTEAAYYEMDPDTYGDYRWTEGGTDMGTVPNSVFWQNIFPDDSAFTYHSIMTPISEVYEQSGGLPHSLPTDGDRIVFTGTYGTYSYDEVFELLGTADPSNGMANAGDGPYPIIVLDTPQTMTLNSVDGLRSGTVTLIRVENNALAGYEGEHHTFSIDAEMTYWPSDARMPLGEPGTKDIHVVQ